MIYVVRMVVVGGKDVDIAKYAQQRNALLEAGEYSDDHLQGKRSYRKLAEKVLTDDAIRIGEIDAEDTASSSPLGVLMMIDHLVPVPEIDGELIVRTHQALNRATEHTHLEVADPDTVASWMGERSGKRVFYEIA